MGTIMADKQNTANKNKFCLQIASKAKEFIADKEVKALVGTAVKTSLEGLKNKNNIAEDIYDRLECFTIFQEDATDERQIDTWNAIIDAFAIVCKNAYLEAEAEYFPEPIELVDDDTIEHMVRAFLSVSESDLEIDIHGEKILRLWIAAGCEEMNEAHHIQRYLPNAWAIGDDEGEYVIVYVKDEAISGLYAVPFGDLDDNEMIFLAHSLSEFLFDEVGIDIFLDL